MNVPDTIAGIEAGTVTVGIEQITPEMAREWLSQNTRNRSVRSRVVELYARDMAAQRWHMTGEPVTFDSAGQLLNGQHRLLACTQAGVPFATTVVRGLATHAQEFMDSGAKRSASDALGLRGHKNRTLLAATARMAMTVQEYGYQHIGKVSFTNAEVYRFVEDHDLYQHVDRAMYVHKQIDASPTVIAYAMWRLHALDPYKCAEFFDRAADGVDLKTGDPILVMIRRFRNARRDNENLQGMGAAQLSVIFRAWNARCSGKPLTTFPVWTSKGQAVQGPEPVAPKRS
jgi:hypothetical protein